MYVGRYKNLDDDVLYGMNTMLKHDEKLIENDTMITQRTENKDELECVVESLVDRVTYLEKENERISEIVIKLLEVLNNTLDFVKRD